MANGQAQPQQNDGQSFQKFGEEEEVLNVRAEVTKRRGRIAALIDWAGAHLAHPPFFIGLTAVHLLWIALNSGIVPGVEPWDPYPFMFLATIASVEAPILSLLIIMRQHRDERVAELREEIEVQVTLHMERELTAALHLLRELQEKLNVQTQLDRQMLDELQRPLDPEQLMHHLEKHLNEAEGEDEE